MSYFEKGWDLRKEAIDIEVCKKILEEGLSLRARWKELSSWKGISCASQHSPILRDFYCSWLPNIATEYLGKDLYYFNDQMVIKNPKDNLTFKAHYDNYYGPNRQGKIHTVNLAIILDDFTEENGAIEVKNQDDLKWNKLYPKRGDLLAINGNTYHKSGINNSQKPRGLYACVYTEAPIDLEGFYNTKVSL